MIKYAAVFIPALHRSKNGRNSCTYNLTFVPDLMLD